MVQGLGTARKGRLGGNDFKRDFTAATGRITPLRHARRLWTHADVGFVESKYLLAQAGRGDFVIHRGQMIESVLLSVLERS